MIIEYYCKILGIYNNLTVTNHIDLECLVYHYFTRHHKIKKYWKNWYIIVIHPSRPGSISIGTIGSTTNFFNAFYQIRKMFGQYCKLKIVLISYSRLL